MKQALTDHIALRMDYSRIAYNSIFTYTNDGLVTKETKLSPNQQLLEFGIVINFS